MELTPNKLPLKECCFCCQQSIRHLSNLRNKLGVVGPHILEVLCHDVSQEDAEYLYGCQTCLRQLQKFSELKCKMLTVFPEKLKRVQHVKRLKKSGTEEKDRPHQKKMKTIEWLTKSVEKLKLRQVQDDPQRLKARRTLIPEQEITCYSNEEEATCVLAKPIDGGTFAAEESTSSSNKEGVCEGATGILANPIVGVGLASEEHSYAVAEKQTENVLETALATLQESVFLHEEDIQAIPKSDCERFLEALNQETPMPTSKLAFLICKCYPLKTAIKQLILKDLEHSLQTKFKKDSMLHHKGTRQLLQEDIFASVINEMNEKIPFLLDMLKICCHSKTDTSKMAMVATVFGMLMHSRVKQLSTIQRLFTALCIRYHADNMLLNRLNSINVTLSETSKPAIVKDFGNFSEQTIIQEVRAGKDGKINGDNLDFRVRTGDMRVSSRDKDYHFFASDWTPDRVDASRLDDDRPRGDINSLNVQTFVPSLEEIKKYKADMKVCIARDLVDIFPCFQWMKLLVEEAIPHELSEEMSHKSKPCMMPVLLKNENNYSDCIEILSSYQEQVHHWYHEAERDGDLETLNIPIGGDQLTRVRLQGAKSLRAGAHTREERLENLTPIVVEFFHVLQDFLEKLCKRFLKLDKCREKGTLANLKILIQRTNVNGQVKVRFKAHEDFVMTAGKAYLTEMAMEYFGMDDRQSSPSLHQPPLRVEKLQRSRRQQVFDNIMDGFVNQYIVPFQLHEKNTEAETMSLELKTGPTVFTTTTVQVQDKTVTFNLAFPGQNPIRVSIPVSLLQAGKPVIVPLAQLNTTLTIQKKEELPDDLNGYVLNFMQWYFIMKNFKDAVKQGDTGRCNICLKLMIPHFYMHSKFSKYFVECIDYILKTEILLSPHMAMRVQAGSFINRKGKPGKNKPADMEKENQVKFLKDLIRGLGRGKSEKAVVNITKAGPVFQQVSCNFDSLVGVKAKSSSHKPKSSSEDLDILYEHLRHLRPFTFSPGRRLNSFEGFTQNQFQSINREDFSNLVQKTYDRLKRQQPVETQDMEEETTLV